MLSARHPRSVLQYRALSAPRPDLWRCTRTSSRSASRRRGQREPLGHAAAERLLVPYERRGKDHASRTKAAEGGLVIDGDHAVLIGVDSAILGKDVQTRCEPGPRRN